METGLKETALAAALEAGQLLREGFGTAFEISSKEGYHNLVTEYDHKAEKCIISHISKKYPNHSFFAEESGKSGSGDVEWIIDPIDGTVNFAHNIPMFCVSIAATYNGEVLVGAIYHPILDELFVAEKGKGATLNGKSLQVTTTKKLEHAIVAVGFPYNVAENPLHCLDHFSDLARLGTPIRRMGSAALDLAYLAAGRFDTFWEVSLRPWDYAAGMLLVQEAGGRVTNFDDEIYTTFEEGPIAASNGHLHQELLRHMNDY